MLSFSIQRLENTFYTHLTPVCSPIGRKSGLDGFIPKNSVANLSLFGISLGEPTSSKAFRYISLLEAFGHTLSMPYSKKITTHLYELRIRGQQELRILYCFHNNQAIILHTFIKKSQKTPSKEIKTAVKRRSVLTRIESRNKVTELGIR